MKQPKIANSSRVMEGSLAEKAGLNAGDVVTTCDGKPVKTSEEFAVLLAQEKTRR